MLILGINAFNADASAVLLDDGRVVAAVEEERLRRIKHWAGFPALSIAYCLAQRGARLADVDRIAVNQDNGANLGARSRFLSGGGAGLLDGQARQQPARPPIEALLAESFGAMPAVPVLKVEHHLAHLASAFLDGPFDDAALISVDGFGDFASTAWGAGYGSDLRIDGRIHFPHSLGVFYQALTQFLGFEHYGDEYKVMGLAPYGKPVHLAPLRQVLASKPDATFALDLSFFRHHREFIAHSWDGGGPDVATLFSDRLADLLGPRRAPTDPLEPRHHDIAASTQALYEEVLFTLLNRLHRSHPVDAIAIAGGCAQNSVANGRIRAATPFRRVHVPAAAGDAGGAMGAARIADRLAMGAARRGDRGRPGRRRRRSARASTRDRSTP